MSQQPKTAITNVRVFDGAKLTEPTTVVIEGDTIVSDATNAVEVDGNGGVLLPGLIDAHVHCMEHDHLYQMAKAGITTALDMGSWPPTLVDSFRNQRGRPDFRSAGLPLTAPGSSHDCLGTLPKDSLVSSPAQAVSFVGQRVAEGADYIKLIADVPGPSQEVLDAATNEARAHGKLVVAHATVLEAVRMALKAKVHFLTHVPIDQAVEEGDVKVMLEEAIPCIPTLHILQKVHALNIPGTDYAHCRSSVQKMHAAGVPILAGTDSNAIPNSPAHVEHGPSIHHELELLTQAGLSPVEALAAATSVPAKHFGLEDRGVIEAGRRADLLLVEGDPTVDITATRRVRRVWCAGVEVD